MRPLCKVCRKKSAAVNYYKDRRAFYRSMCDSCGRNGGKVKGLTRWQAAGYRKKDVCEKCGFKAKHSDQLDVYHVDGDLNNCALNNLKTVCANCQRILHREGIKWRQGDLVPDL